MGLGRFIGNFSSSIIIHTCHTAYPNIYENFRQSIMHHSFLKASEVFWLSQGKSSAAFPIFLILNCFVSFPPLYLALMPCPIKGFFQLYTSTDHLSNDDFIHGLLPAWDCCPQWSFPKLSSSFYAPVLHVCLHSPHSCYWWPQSNKNVPPAFFNPLIYYVKSL